MEEIEDQFPYNYPVESYILTQHMPVIGKIPLGKHSLLFIYYSVLPAKM